MNRNRIMWGIVSLVVLMTIAIAFGTPDSHSQQKPQPTPSQQSSGYDDLSKYAIADFDAPESRNASERERRQRISERYDDQDLVLPNPHPNDGGAMVYDEMPPAPLFPVSDSDLIIIGRTISGDAFLSNNKRGVYTEFAVQIDQMLKNDTGTKLSVGVSVFTDRAGGFVRYRDGKKLIYKIAEHRMLWTNSSYLLFLSSDKQSPNYKLLTGYELVGDRIEQLDTGRSFEEFKNMTRSNFIDMIRTAIKTAHRSSK